MKSLYKIDPAHSSIRFSVRHLMISNVRGGFTGVSGEVAFDPENLNQSTIDAEVDVATVSTGDANRDGHLKTAEFFDVEQFPKMSFKSTAIEKADDGYKVSGDLSLHGVTKPVTLTVEDVSEENKDPWGNLRIGTSAKGKLNRKDFGLNWNAALETGGVMVGDEVKIEFDLQLVKS
jgi:polyisoprenoid-binding protein YceI